MFRSMVKRSLPTPVQTALDGVVGFSKMDWPLYSEHIAHHVKQYRLGEKAKKDTQDDLLTRLAQLQIKDLTDKTKKKMMPVITADDVAPPPPQPIPPPLLHPASSGNMYRQPFLQRGQGPRGRGRGRPWQSGFPQTTAQ